MNVKIINTIEGSCCFCDKSKLSENGKYLQYPYKTVIQYEKEGGGLSPRMCKDCVIEFTEKANDLFKEKQQG